MKGAPRTVHMPRRLPQPKQLKQLEGGGAKGPMPELQPFGAAQATPGGLNRHRGHSSQGEKKLGVGNGSGSRDRIGFGNTKHVYIYIHMYVWH